MRLRTVAILAFTVLASVAMGAGLALIERSPAADEPARTCSAAGVEEPAPQAGLPDVVEVTRERIVGAALACDFEALELLAGGRFTSGAPEGGSPAAFWRDAEDQGIAVFARLVEILTLPYAQVEVEMDGGDQSIYVWPSAFSDDATPGDWSAVGRLYEPHIIASMRERGGYVGHRVGITLAGEWIFFVEGD